jgi:hypothetical protein
MLRHLLPVLLFRDVCLQLPLPKLGQAGVVRWLQVRSFHFFVRRCRPARFGLLTMHQSFIGEFDISVSNVIMLALFGLWFFIRAM